MELFCPEHGIPAILFWLFFGSNPGIFFLFVQMKVASWLS